MESERVAAETINPYAPSVNESSSANLSSPLGLEIIPDQRVVISTIKAVSFAGAAFGLFLVLMFFAATWFAFGRLGGQSVSGEFVQGMIAYSIIIPFIGFLIAGLSAAFIAPALVWVVRRYVMGPGENWDRSSIRWFGAFTGALSGWAAVVVMSGFQPFALILGMLPGGIGLIVTPVFLRRLLREADVTANQY